LLAHFVKLEGLHQNLVTFICPIWRAGFNAP